MKIAKRIGWLARSGHADTYPAIALQTIRAIPLTEPVRLMTGSPMQSSSDTIVSPPFGGASAQPPACNVIAATIIPSTLKECQCGPM